MVNFPEENLSSRRKFIFRKKTDEKTESVFVRFFDSKNLLEVSVLTIFWSKIIFWPKMAKKPNKFLVEVSVFPEARMLNRFVEKSRFLTILDGEGIISTPSRVPDPRQKRYCIRSLGHIALTSTGPGLFDTHTAVNYNTTGNKGVITMTHGP